jgi:aminoglycoside 3-N-acetyltransferase
MRDRKRAWIEYEELDYHGEDFAELGGGFAATGGERTAKIGAGIGRLLPMREIIDYGVRWLTEHRPQA